MLNRTLHHQRIELVSSPLLFGGKAWENREARVWEVKYLRPGHSPLSDFYVPGKIIVGFKFEDEQKEQGSQALIWWADLEQVLFLGELPLDSRVAV